MEKDTLLDKILQNDQAELNRQIENVHKHAEKLRQEFKLELEIRDTSLMLQTDFEIIHERENEQPRGAIRRSKQLDLPFKNIGVVRKEKEKDFIFFELVFSNQVEEPSTIADLILLAQNYTMEGSEYKFSYGNSIITS